jgi:hypothetical protein
MAPANRPSTLAKVKTRDSVNPEVDSFYVAGSTPALSPLAAAQSTLKPTINVGFSEKWLDSSVDNGEEEVECQTPKSEEHKIPPLLCCPPAPRKPKWIPVKRKLPASPLQGFNILSDFDLQSLFGSDLANINHQHMKKKLRTGETSLPRMSEKEGKGRSYEEYNVEINSLYGEVYEQ